MSKQVPNGPEILKVGDDIALNAPALCRWLFELTDFETVRMPRNLKTLLRAYQERIHARLQVMLATSGEIDEQQAIGQTIDLDALNTLLMRGSSIHELFGFLANVGGRS